MKISELRNKLLAEIQQVPEDQLIDLYNLIHAFRLNTVDSDDHDKAILKFAGCWNEMPNETYTEFVDEIVTRR
jgi:hypothetical protein